MTRLTDFLPSEPSASAAEPGVVELATIAETNTGTDATRAVTPDGLDGWTGSAQLTEVGIIASGTWQGNPISTSYISNLSGSNTGDEPAASLTVPGIVELATVAETNAGTDATRAVTPDGLDGWTGSAQITAVGIIASGTWQGSAISTTYVQNLSGTNTGDEVAASTATAGIIELATQIGTNNGTDTVRAVTPSTLTNFGGTFATLKVAGLATFEGAIDEQVYDYAGAAPTIDPANGTIQWWFLTANATATDSLTNGTSVTLHIEDGSAYSITWPAAINWIGGSAPQLDATDETVIELWRQNNTTYGALVGVAFL